jgi:poly(3-hydroxybutyrate) depolymerase
VTRRGIAFAGALLMAHESVAQHPRLTVRPVEMATGTRTAQAGERQLSQFNNALLYVPAQCVGTKRCPLVLLLHGGGEDARHVMDRQHQFADQYGMLILAPNAVTPGRWDFIAETPEGRAFDRVTRDFQAGRITMSQMMSSLRQRPTHTDSVAAVRTDTDVKNIDAALKLVLREYAVDPAKIAVTGMSDGGSYAIYLGRNNQDVFSRIVPESPGVASNAGAGPEIPATQFLCVTGMVESGTFFRYPFVVASNAQRQGHVAELVTIFRSHEGRTEDEALIWRWIHQSWITPGVPLFAATDTARDVLLTPEALTAMTTFWQRFMREPDSIRTTGRKAHQKQVRVRIGGQHVLLPMMDMPAMAAGYPSVASDLQQAGLTAAQEDAYRVALASASMTQRLHAADVSASSALAKNIAVLQANLQRWRTLSATKIWITP